MFAGRHGPWKKVLLASLDVQRPAAQEHEELASGYDRPMGVALGMGGKVRGRQPIATTSQSLPSMVDHL